MSGFKVVIPARYASTRLPGKPLREIAGRPMLLHVVERARESGAGQVVVATDDARIRQMAEAAGVEVCMTAASHASGTERLAEVVERYGWAEDTVLVNLQGDEPCMSASLVDQVAEDMLRHEDAVVTTLATPLAGRGDLFHPHAVKVVTDRQGYALYFSRAPIPWHRDEFSIEAEHLPTDTPFLRHIGLYAYRAGFLGRYIQWAPSPLEMAESLEQLRVLWHGGRIHVSIADTVPGHGVDTPEDLARVEILLSAPG
ncbi:MAG: 3-deoxy-manno-octulosonate cytidylyltransferase [Gammaproteobacteria bacterium]|nr:3-deoxy-manno-octulosonate cytidylyltransferase [Gammaproteobacteria bacterium]MBU1653691.1 3-deoxy-manno-octulosonate cytidylyltransferase [Gammaproteobacteria bacterium]MBU1960902.1 3-deoxy-manno-octulosonate cytidylyltransferase [Gammaproteobacteria bacterium]